MKIIKAGKEQEKPEDRLYTGTCWNCGCEVECKKCELEYDREAWRDIPGTPTHIVVCPTKNCGVHIRMIPKMSNEYLFSIMNNIGG